MRPPTTPLSARNIARRIALGLESQCRDCHAPLRIVEVSHRRWNIRCPQCNTKPQTLIAPARGKAYFEKTDPTTSKTDDAKVAEQIEAAVAAERIAEAERWRHLVHLRDGWWMKQFDDIQHLVAGEVARRRYRLAPPEIQPGPGARLVDVDPEDFQREAERLWDGGEDQPARMIREHAQHHERLLDEQSKVTPLDRMLAALKSDRRADVRVRVARVRARNQAAGVR